jgi:hypothetical protein
VRQESRFTFGRLQNFSGQHKIAALMRTQIAIAIAFTLLIATSWGVGQSALVQYSNDKPQVSKHKPNDANPNGAVTQTAPMPANGPSTTEKAENTGTYGGNQEIYSSSPDQRIVNLTFALAIVAILQFGAMMAQFWAMYRQARYMREGLEETRKAAEAAKKSAEISERTLKLSQGSFLGIGECYISASGVIHMELKNHGLTNALNVTVLCDIAGADGHQIMPLTKLGPLVVPIDDVPKVVFGKIPMVQDSSGGVSAIQDIRCSANILYDDVFSEGHMRSYILYFDRITMTARIEKETG